MTGITHYQSSSGPIALADMAYPHLLNAIRKREKEVGGNPDEIVDALRAELASRPAAPETHVLQKVDPSSPEKAQALRESGGLPPGPALPGLGHNNPPEPTIEEFRTALEKEHDEFLKLAGRAEMARAALPKADTIATDEDVEKIDKWVVGAAKVASQAEKLHKAAKAPYLERGRVIDDLFLGLVKDLRAAIKSVEERKKPYLLAKANRARAELAARQEADRKAAAELAAAEQRARDEAAAAQAAIDEAAARLTEAEGVRATHESSAIAQGEADGSAPDLTTAEVAGADVDAAEADLRGAAVDATNATAEANRLALAKEAALESAASTEAALANPTHVLATTGASGLKAVWKHRIAKPLEFIRSHPLIEYLSDDAVEAALKRAAKAETRPTIPGVEFFEDYEATTSKR